MYQFIILTIMNSENIKKTIILAGIKHCGKSTQGRRLSDKLAVPFYDTDDLIEELEGITPREIYNRGGKEAFMLAEENACRELKNRLSSGAAVVATGGGICDNDKAVEILKELGVIVFLMADEHIAAARIVREARLENGELKNLPAYIAKENPQSLDEVRALFHSFYQRRTASYKEIAAITVEMKNASKSENTSAILKAVRSYWEQN